MYEVKENIDVCLRKTLLEKFSHQINSAGGAINDFDRMFMLLEGGEILGIGIIGLVGAEVQIKTVTNCSADDERDLLFRSVLNVIKGMCNIKVTCSFDGDYLQKFGFKTVNGLIGESNESDKNEIMSQDIKFYCMGNSR